MPPLCPMMFLAAAHAVAFRQGKPASLDPKGVRLPVTQPDEFPHISTAAFVNHVGFRSHSEINGTSIWPFRVNADCDDLARIADKRGVLHSRTPEEGSIYLRWSAQKGRFVRAGIVLGAMNLLPTTVDGWGYECLVLEGGARLSPVGKGWKGRPGRFETTVLWTRTTLVRCHPSHGDRFISWVDLDGRDPSAVSFPPRLSQMPSPWKAGHSLWRKRGARRA